MGKFVIKGTASGIRFDLKAGNGEIIASSEVYNYLESCEKGIASVKKNAPLAGIENQTAKSFSPKKHPKFEVYRDKAGEYRFRLKAANGKIIAVSEGYKALESCLNGIDAVQKNVLDAKIVRE